MDPIRQTPDGAVLLNLHVQPGAKRTEFMGIHGEAIKIRLAAPPVEGKANACLLAFLSDFTGLPKRAVVLLQGETNRSKLVRIDGSTSAIVCKLYQAAGLTPPD